ncbi:hypothetical protein [Leuconostoc suionicum]
MKKIINLFVDKQNRQFLTGGNILTLIGGIPILEGVNIWREFYAKA